MTNKRSEKLYQTRMSHEGYEALEPCDIDRATPFDIRFAARAALKRLEGKGE